MQKKIHMLASSLLCTFSLATQAALIGPNSQTNIGLTVLVDGSSKVFSLDTGASFTMLSADFQTLAYPVIDQEQASGVAGVPMSCQKIKVPQVQLDTLTRKAFTAARCKTRLQEGSGINNLGMDFLEGQIFSLEFSTGKFNLLSTSPLNNNFQPLQRSKQGHLLLPTSWGNTKDLQLAVFDTGFSITAVDAKFVAANPSLFTPAHPRFLDSAKDITGAAVKAQYYMVTSLQIGNVNFGPQLIQAIDFPESQQKITGANMIIGFSTMYMADWIFKTILGWHSPEWGQSLRSIFNRAELHRKTAQPRRFFRPLEFHRKPPT
jgi:hypothetical protein